MSKLTTPWKIDDSWKKHCELLAPKRMIVRFAFYAVPHRSVSSMSITSVLCFTSVPSSPLCNLGYRHWHFGVDRCSNTFVKAF